VGAPGRDAPRRRVARVHARGVSRAAHHRRVGCAAHARHAAADVRAAHAAAGCGVGRDAARGAALRHQHRNRNRERADSRGGGDVHGPERRRGPRVDTACMAADPVPGVVSVVGGWVIAGAAAVVAGVPLRVPAAVPPDGRVLPRGQPVRRVLRGVKRATAATAAAAAAARMPVLSPAANVHPARRVPHKVSPGTRLPAGHHAVPRARWRVRLQR
jgi:hypothetical protein